MTLRNFSTKFALLAALLAASSLRADDSNSISVGVDSLLGNFNNAKYDEYRNNDRSVRYNGSGHFGLLDDQDALRFGLDLNAIGLSRENAADGATAGDADIALSAEMADMFKLDFDWSRFGHTFVEGANTVFNPASAGTNHLTLDPGAQAALKGATTSTVTGIMKGLTGTGNTINSGLDRDRMKASLALYASEHSTATLSFDHEIRKGTRPLGQSMDGTSVSMEILEPIDYRTWDVGLDYAFNRAWFISDLSYHHRQFENENLGLRYDNPFNALGTDKNGVAAVGGGAVTGQVALAPSNADDAFGADVIVKLPAKTRVEAKGSYSTYTQNANFLPFSSNVSETAVALINGAMAAPSAGSLNGKVTSITGALKAQSDPFQSLRLKAASEYWEHDNQSALVMTDAAYKNADYQSSASTRFYPVYENWVESKNSVGATWRFVRSSSLGASYWHDNKGITGGLASSMAEDGGKLNLDSQSLTWLGWSLGAERSSRSTDYYPAGNPALKQLVPSNIAGSTGDLTLDRMYYQAARDRNAGTAKLNLLFGGWGNAVLGYTLANDNYRKTIFGLVDDTTQSYSVDMDIEITDWLSLDPSYIYEAHTGAQRNAASFNVANMNNPLTDPGVWTGTSYEYVQTVALTLSMRPLDRLLLNVGGSYTGTDGRMAFKYYGGGWVPNDIPLDDSHNLALETKATLKVVENLHLSAGYQYATFSFNSYLTDNQPNFNTNGGASATPTRFLLVLDSQPVSYTVQTLSASADYVF